METVSVEQRPVKVDNDNDANLSLEDAGETEKPPTSVALRTEKVSFIFVITSMFVPDSTLGKINSAKNATSDAFNPTIDVEEFIPDDATPREKEFFRQHKYLFKPSSRDTYDNSSKAAKSLWDKLPKVLKYIVSCVWLILFLLLVIPLIYCFFSMITKVGELMKVIFLLSIGGIFQLVWIFYI